MSHDDSSPNQTTTTPQVDEVVVTDVNVPPPEKTTTPTIPLELEQDPHPEPEKDKNNPVVETVTLESHLSKPNADSDTFKDEQTTKSSDLSDNENKSLQELKNLIQQALDNHQFSTATVSSTTIATPEKEEPAKQNGEEEDAKKKDEEEEEGDKKEEEKEEDVKKTDVVVGVDDDGAKTVEAIEESVVAVSSSVSTEQEPVTEKLEAKEEASLPKQPEEVSIWGIPLLADKRSDVILLKFLRARDFKVKEAFTMIKNTIRWRNEFKMEELLDEKLGDELEKFVYMHGFDKEGHPVCYNIYGEFQDKELYKKCFSDEEKREKFLRWRIQFLEKSIRNLDFDHGGICTIVQVNDLKDSPGPGKWELRQATKQALQLLQDNYPEFVAKQVLLCYQTFFFYLFLSLIHSFCNILNYIHVEIKFAILDI